MAYFVVTTSKNFGPTIHAVWTRRKWIACGVLGRPSALVLNHGHIYATKENAKAAITRMKRKYPASYLWRGAVVLPVSESYDSFDSWPKGD